MSTGVGEWLRLQQHRKAARQLVVRQRLEHDRAIEKKQKCLSEIKLGEGMLIPVGMCKVCKMRAVLDTCGYSDIWIDLNTSAI